MRNIVERFFCKMKDMRRLATRFEKKAINFLSMVQFFASMVQFFASMVQFFASMVQLFAIRCWLS